MSQILVVDDEVGIRELLSEILREEGHQVRLAENAGEARLVRNRSRPDLVLLDIWMPDTDGISLSGGRRQPADYAVVMMSGHGTIDTAPRGSALCVPREADCIAETAGYGRQALRQAAPAATALTCLSRRARSSAS